MYRITVIFLSKSFLAVILHMIRFLQLLQFQVKCLGETLQIQEISVGNDFRFELLAENGGGPVHLHPRFNR